MYIEKKRMMSLPFEGSDQTESGITIINVPGFTMEISRICYIQIYNTSTAHIGVTTLEVCLFAALINI